MIVNLGPVDIFDPVAVATSLARAQAVAVLARPHPKVVGDLLGRARELTEEWRYSPDQARDDHGRFGEGGAIYDPLTEAALNKFVGTAGPNTKMLPAELALMSKAIDEHGTPAPELFRGTVEKGDYKQVLERYAAMRAAQVPVAMGVSSFTSDATVAETYSAGASAKETAVVYHVQPGALGLDLAARAESVVPGYGAQAEWLTKGTFEPRSEAYHPKDGNVHVYLKQLSTAVAEEQRYSADQPRDDHGRFGVGEGDEHGAEVRKEEYNKLAEAAFANATHEQRQAAEVYGPQGMEVNTALRSGSGYKQYVAYGTGGAKYDIIPHLDSLIAANTTARDMTLYRAANLKFLQTLKVGDHYVDHGYTSATSSRDFANEHAWSRAGTAARIEVQVPAGSHAVALDRMAHYGEMNEMLLARDSEFEVISAGLVPVIRLVNK